MNCHVCEQLIEEGWAVGKIDPCCSRACRRKRDRNKAIMRDTPPKSKHGCAHRAQVLETDE